MKDYRSDIDGLRAIAILVVVLFHAKITGFSGGFVGVDVFFVISGFLITTHLSAEYLKTNTIDLPRFYSKRITRLFPALLFTITVSFIAYFYLFSSYGKALEDFVGSIKYSLFALANFYFLRKTGNYFDTRTDDLPLLHFWSLSLEEQFYLVWPLLFITAIYFWPKRFNLSTENKLRVIFISICVVSFTLAEFWIFTGKSQHAFFLMPARAWELGFGGLIALYKKELGWLVARQSKITLNFASVLGLLLILISCLTFDSITRFPGAYALLPVVGTVLLIVTGFSDKSDIKRLLSIPLIVKLGVLSYGWYLWHWPALSFLNIYYLGDLPPLKFRLLAVAGSLIMAKVSLDYVEKPFRYGNRIKSLSPRVLILGTVTVTSSFVLFSILTLNFYNSLFPPLQGENLLTELDKRSNKKLTDDCFNPPTRCSIQSSRSEEHIYLWGDSHALAYVPLLESIAQISSVNATVLARTSLLPLSGVWGFRTEEKRKLENLIADNEKALEAIKKVKKKKSVILAARWASYLGQKPISKVDQKAYLVNEQFENASEQELSSYIKQTIANLKAAGVSRIFIMLQFPEFNIDVRKCLKQELGCKVSLSEFFSYRSVIDNYFYELAKQDDSIQVIDPSKYFCTDEYYNQIVKVNEKYYLLTYDDDRPSGWAAKGQEQINASF